MKKKIFITIAALIFIVFTGIIYLNYVILPVKVKNLLIEGIEKSTQKKAKIDSLQFNIFKGLVLRGVSVYDKGNEILKLKEAVCGFLIWPVFKKNIIIPSITLKSPEIFAQRNSDGTFNLAKSFPVSTEKSSSDNKDNGFKVFIYTIQVIDGRINFKDNTISPVFTKNIDNLDLKMNLSLPAKVKFNAGLNIISHPPAAVTITGEYNIIEKQLLSKISLKDLSPKDYSAYYHNAAVEALEGQIDGLIELSLKDKNLNINLNALTKKLKLSKNNLSAVLDSVLKVNYVFFISQDKKPDYSGSIIINNCKFSGSQFMEAINDLSADIKFDTDGLNWENFNFKYLNTDYSSLGKLTDFASPRISAQLSSLDGQLDASLAVNGKIIKVDNLSGKYIDSSFSAAGNFNLADSPGLDADIKADMDIELNNLSKAMKEFNVKVPEIKISGPVHVDASASGNIKDFKSCNIKAVFSADKLSVFGLKTGDFILDYTQKDYLAEFSRMHLSLYDGALDATAKINLDSPKYPFEGDITIQGVKIEKLKMDTALKDKDISGTVSGTAGFNANILEFFNLTGAGNILISDGKLWQLDLLKGVGSLIFMSDFTNVVFKRAGCDFNIKDKHIFTDNLELNSNLCDITGKATIGFDKSIDAILNVQLSQLVQLKGAVKDIAAMVIGTAGKFTEVKITGTLDSPKYKFKPATSINDIIGGIKDIFFK
ncbi:MAG: AsmA-like C-terminal domain-containing protein [Candidatus Omnitrophota bacterium]